MMRVLVPGLLAAMVTTALAATPSQICQSSKNKEAGKYSYCRQRAEAKYATTGNPQAYQLALEKCAKPFAVKWPLIEAKAEGTCPSIADLTQIQGAIDAHTSALATALAGGSLPDCDGELATCQGDLGTCSGDLASCLAGQHSRNLSTGQTTCWNVAGTSIPCAGTGQDGELQKGLTRSYTDNGDGTITDNRTGLMWEKLSDDGSIHDQDDRFTWIDAFTKVGALNQGGGFAGYSDWRLPNVLELLTLVNFAARNPATWPEFNTGCVPGCTITMCSCTSWGYVYWSSSTYAGVENNAWPVNFGDGGLRGFDKSENLPVRAVRGGF